MTKNNKMTLSEVIKRNEEKFENKFVVLNSGQLLLTKQLEKEGVYKPKESIKELKSFLRASQEEAYKAGEENVRERIRELPQGHTPDGRYHWVSVEDIDDLLQELTK